jgi:hydrogenase nickel incorporation protein HypB
MCVVCGCSGPGATVSGAQHAHEHHGHEHEHGHGYVQGHAQPPLDFGANAARVSVPGMSAERAIQLEARVLGANDAVAQTNQQDFIDRGVLAYNFVSSPGSGKTTLLVATIQALKQMQPSLPVAVIEGDQQTSHDADRIRATGAPAVQVNTGKGCHLDAPMVAAAFDQLRDGLSTQGSLLLIENVGNLVCPAMWALGERAKVVILSVTEGEDKPLKYPDMFAAASLMVLTKIDLLPHLDFDVARCIDYALRINPGIQVLLLSARSGQGMDAWLEWLLNELPIATPAPDVPVQLTAGAAS